MKIVRNVQKYRDAAMIEVRAAEPLYLCSRRLGRNMTLCWHAQTLPHMGAWPAVRL